MKGRKVYRDNTIIYPDLYYVWTWRPNKYWKNHNKITEYSLYKKHICGVGFYSRYHAKHVLVNTYGVDVLAYIHVIKGKRLIKYGITTVPKKYSEKIFFKNGTRKVRRWIYPQEYGLDSHRRRHFIVYMVRTAEDQGVKAFNKKYKRYFYGYRSSFPKSYYNYKRNKVTNTLVQEICKAKGLREEDVRRVCPWVFSRSVADCSPYQEQKKKISQEEVL